jgi:hypothetical protein
MPTLTTLTNTELEITANDFLLAGNIEGEEACLLEMLRRDHWPVEWLEELTEMAA